MATFINGKLQTEATAISDDIIVAADLDTGADQALPANWLKLASPLIFNADMTAAEDITKVMIWSDAIGGNIAHTVPTGKIHAFKVSSSVRFRVTTDGPEVPNTVALNWRDSGNTRRPVLSLDGSNVVILSNDAAAHILIQTDSAAGVGNLTTRMIFLAGAAQGAGKIEVYEPFTFRIAMTVTATAAQILSDGDAGSIFYNVPTSKTHTLTVNNVIQLRVNSTGIQLINAKVIAWLDSGAVSRNVLTLDGSNNVIFSNDATGNVIIQTDNAAGAGNLVSRLIFLAGAVQGNARIEVYEPLTFRAAMVGQSTMSMLYSDADAGNMTLNLPGTKAFNINSGASVYMSVNSTQINAGAGVKVQEGGVSISPIGKHDTFIGAEGMAPSNTGGASAVAKVEIGATNGVDVHVIDFDQTTEESAQFKVSLPNNWNAGTITVFVKWTASAGTPAEGVVWGIKALARGDDDPIDTAFGAEVNVTDTLLALADEHLSAESAAITIGGTPADGDTLYFKISRKVGDAADNLAGDARLIGVKIRLTTDAAVAA